MVRPQNGQRSGYLAGVVDVPRRLGNRLTDYGVPEAASARPIDASEPLQEGLDRGGVRDEGVEVDVQADFDDLGGDEHRSRPPTRATGSDPFGEIRLLPVAVLSREPAVKEPRSFTDALPKRVVHLL